MMEITVESRATNIDVRPLGRFFEVEVQQDDLLGFLEFAKELGAIPQSRGVGSASQYIEVLLWLSVAEGFLEADVDKLVTRYNARVIGDGGVWVAATLHADSRLRDLLLARLSGLDAHVEAHSMVDVRGEWPAAHSKIVLLFRPDAESEVMRRITSVVHEIHEAVPADAPLTLTQLVNDSES